MVELRVIVLACLALGSVGCAAFGKQASGARLERMMKSPQWRNGEFRNPQKLWNDLSLSNMTEAFSEGSDHPEPESADQIPVVRGQQRRFSSPPQSGLRITWFGHSSVLIEIDGQRILTDPVWSNALGPVPWAGPKRWYPPPLPLEQLPKIDAVVISHDHNDHLDYPTIDRMKAWDTKFFVPLGVGAHLEYWGVPAANIVELDWWERGRVGDLEVVCTPARHASGRHLFDLNETLWAGWALVGPRHRVFFSGDTGLFDGMKTIGRRLGPFDVTMVESGAYNKRWPDWHIGPEQAVLAHRWLRGKLFIPIHWGLFDLALHGWTEPAERVSAAAARAKVRLYIPKPGESVEPAEEPKQTRWWPDVPWTPAARDPIISTSANGRQPGPKRVWLDPFGDDEKP